MSLVVTGFFSHDFVQWIEFFSILRETSLSVRTYENYLLLGNNGQQRQDLRIIKNENQKTVHTSSLC
jgi:hypothetical protein